MPRAQSLWTAFIVLSASPVLAVAEPFPTSFERDALLAWILEETDVRPVDVVSIGATDVIAIENVSPAEAGKVRLSIHAEIVSAEVAQAEGYLSWHGDMQVDCMRNALRVQSIRNYAERNLKGDGLNGQVGDTWVEPGMGSQLYSVVRSACDADYPRPFEGVETVAQAEPAEASTGVADEAAAASPAPKANVQSVAASPQPAKPSGKSAAVVQIGAAPSADLAQLEIKRVQARFASGRDLTPKVERAVVGGRTVYRARFGGFDSFEDASDFCRTLKAGAQDCFVRDGRG